MTSRRMVFGRYDYAGFLSFAAYACCSVVIPLVLYRMAPELDFPLEDGGMAAGGALQLGRSIPMVAAMLLCGFVAGRWGKYSTLGASLLIMGLGILLAAVSPWYGLVFAAVAMAGLGEGVIEGLATPFIQDLHPVEPGRYINFTHSFWSVGVLGMVTVSGLLLYWGVSWRWIVGVAGGATVIPALLLLLPDRRPGARPGSGEAVRSAEVWKHTMEILRRPRFWLFFAAMFVAGGGEFSLTFWVTSYIKIDYASSERVAAFATGCFAVGMIAGRMGWGYLVGQNHLKQLVVYSAVAGTLICSVLPLLSGFENRDLALYGVYALLLLAGLASAPFWPSVQSYCSTRMPESDVTMLFILLSCAGIPGCGFFACLMGVVGDMAGLGAAFYLIPACYVVLALLIGFEWWREKRGH